MQNCFTYQPTTSNDLKQNFHSNLLSWDSFYHLWQWSQPFKWFEEFRNKKELEAKLVNLRPKYVSAQINLYYLTDRHSYVLQII